MVKQLSEGIIEKVTCEAVSGKEFYLPHRPVVREQAETTKVRIVYDASAIPNDGSPSLNDSLETGPPLQNLLWNIIVRNRFKSVSLCGDIKQAFLQIRIKKEDRDCLRFHWAFDQMRRNVETLRFTRAIFGMGQSLFLLNGTIDVHFDEMKRLHNDLKEIIEEIEDDLYVDDLISGGVNVKETTKLKEITKSTFAEAGFVLHKWHSNKRELEDDEAIASSAEQSYAKQTLGVKENESKILGLAWGKKDDTLAVNIQELNVEETKRGMLKFLASIFDPLGFASPVLLVGKLIYREVCEQKFNWDQPLSQELSRRWKRWIGSLPAKVELPRTLAKFEQPINKIDLHVFGDASFDGVSAAVYAAVHQDIGVTQGLITSKSRLAKKKCTMPRLELIASHMAANLMENARSALKRYPVAECFGWSDSTVVLHWVRESGSYKPFVSNRVDKVKEKNYIVWRHVPSEQNPADCGSRGCSFTKLDSLWWDGPSWLLEKENWPIDIITTPSVESESEAKRIKEVLAVAINKKEDSTFQPLLAKYELWKVIRISSWILRFITNCRQGGVHG